MPLSDLFIFSVFIAVNFVAATSGGYFKPGEWYEKLDKPRWNPPKWMFPLAWTIWYTTIATSGFFFYKSAAPGEAFWPLVVYGIHLCLNFAWSAIFFGMRRMDLAFYELIVYWFSILATIVLFYRVNPTAALMLVPYLAFATFAGALNYTVWQMNKGSLSKAA